MSDAEGEGIDWDDWDSFGSEAEPGEDAAAVGAVELEAARELSAPAAGYAAAPGVQDEELWALLGSKAATAMMLRSFMLCCGTWVGDRAMPRRHLRQFAEDYTGQITPATLAGLFFVADLAATAPPKWFLAQRSATLKAALITAHAVGLREALIASAAAETAKVQAINAKRREKEKEKKKKAKEGEEKEVADEHGAEAAADARPPTPTVSSSGHGAAEAATERLCVATAEQTADDAKVSNDAAREAVGEGGSVCFTGSLLERVAAE